MDRDQTIDFLNRHVKTDMLMKHLFTVEAAMRGYARKYGEDEDRWGIAGLLHDFDWEICPTPESTPPTRRNPAEPRLPGGHHPGRFNPRRAYGIPRESLMEHTLFAVDELSGFIRAVTLVRPNKSLDDVSPRSVHRSSGTRTSRRTSTGRTFARAPTSWAWTWTNTSASSWTA